MAERSSDDKGTVRVSASDRAEARKRLEGQVVGVEKTISDSGANAFSTHNSEHDLGAGETVGEYAIEDVIGRGGFGTVYRAVQPLIGKRVAIKVLSRKFSADTEMVSRFVAEARAVNQIRHRNIIDIFSFGQLSDGRQYYIMELLEGDALDAYLAKHGKLDLEVAVPILRAVARALDAAHAKGVAHRDLKPENIFLARDDDGALFPKLLDFGIAKLSGDERAAHRTNTGVPIGTPYYMSPEQCRGSGVDHRTDLYSLGVVTYRLVTGAYPFDGALVDILHKQVYDEPQPPSQRNPALPPHVDASIAWMMRKDPDERPKTAISAIVALQGDLPITPSSPSITNPNVTTAKLSKVTGNARWFAAAAALVVAIGAVVVFFLIGNRDDKKPADPTPVVDRGTDPPQPAPASAPDAAIAALTADAAPVESDHVIVEVTGVPEGTEVLVGAKIVGTAPGPVQLGRDTTKVVLTFRADGYIAQSKPVVPSKDQSLKVTLKKKPRVGGVVRPPSGKDPDDDDVIDVFGKEKKP